MHALDVNLGDKLRSLEGPKCKIGQLDVSDIDAIHAFKSKLGDQPVDVLLNIAGQYTYLDAHSGRPADLRGQKVSCRP